MFVLPHPNYAEIPEPDHDGHEYSVEEIINYSHEHAPGLLDVTPVPERIVIAPQVKYTVRQASTEMILIGMHEGRLKISTVVGASRTSICMGHERDGAQGQAKQLRSVL
ncbi:uncharacterized protein EKO05_0008968 [Ascochyta rabiei]|uniref:uncharacterized protein n=1 Tax=Didymella rabiei TaxID=5454 RepID=UPI002208B423|nr:uncharacterized protein EKO05_0008968 [Ascochyta rabiei]UPX18676.1 hypothetical protein EKO05_0008968 [Ascochyta rabiei]